MARERTLSYGSFSGTRVRKYTGDVELRTVGGGFSHCSDFLGKDSDHPVTIEHNYSTPALITGDTGDILSGYIWDNYPATSMGAAVADIPFPPTPIPDDDWSATHVAANTNPGRPDVSVPLLLFDTLSSLPKTVWDFGNALISQGGRPKKSSNSVAAGNFGWDQLFRDTAALFDFAEHASKRAKELSRLYSKGGLRRSQTVWSANLPQSAVVVLQSQGTWIEAELEISNNFRKWVSTRWRPATADPLPEADQVQKARELVHGWHIAPADVWNAMPWSWLTDYFGNIGDYLAANRNSSEFRLESCCVMYGFERRFKYKKLIHDPALTVTQPSALYATKTRKLGNITLTTNVPVISAQRLTNLLGIAANYSR